MTATDTVLGYLANGSTVNASVETLESLDAPEGTVVVHVSASLLAKLLRSAEDRADEIEQWC